MQVLFSPKNVLRYPRLDTVLMVEKALYMRRSGKTIGQIWRLLPKKVMWQTFMTIVAYLEHSGKIHVEEDRTVTWLWGPEEIERLKRKGLLVR